MEEQWTKTPSNSRRKESIGRAPQLESLQSEHGTLRTQFICLALSEMAKVNVHKGVNTPVLREKERKEEEKEEKAGLKKYRRICPPFRS